MFKEINEALQYTDISVYISKTGDETISVSLVPNPKDGKNTLSPIQVSGTAEELDEQFDSIIGKAMETSLPLLSNVAMFNHTLKSEEKTKKEEAEKKKPGSTEKKPEGKKDTATGKLDL